MKASVNVSDKASSVHICLCLSHKASNIRGCSYLGGNPCGQKVDPVRGKGLGEGDRDRDSRDNNEHGAVNTHLGTQVFSSG